MSVGMAFPMPANPNEHSSTARFKQISNRQHREAQEVRCSPTNFNKFLGGLAQAADRLGRPPSAISLQMKRLQDDLGTALFRKRGRGLVLTEAGEVALTYARRILAMHDELLDTIQGDSLAGNIRIGCPQDFAAFLPSVLSHFASLYPRMQVELLIEGNAALAEAIEKSRIDLAVVIGHEHRSAAQTVGQLELVWIASSTFV